MEENKTIHRKFSKRITTAVLVWAMSLVTAALIFRPEHFVAAMTGVVPLILGVLGTYQGVGHADLRTVTQQRGKGFPGD
jgi:cadmium resistance protein CadD (predicted permease)